MSPRKAFFFFLLHKECQNEIFLVIERMCKTNVSEDIRQELYINSALHKTGIVC